MNSVTTSRTTNGFRTVQTKEKLTRESLIVTEAHVVTCVLPLYLIADAMYWEADWVENHHFNLISTMDVAFYWLKKRYPKRCDYTILKKYRGMLDVVLERYETIGCFVFEGDEHKVALEFFLWLEKAFRRFSIDDLRDAYTAAAQKWANEQIKHRQGKAV